jgi:hypothetical protein
MAKDVSAAGRQGAAVVSTATVVHGAAMERLAAPVDVLRSDTGYSASGASGGRDTDRGRSAAGAATTGALAAHLSAERHGKHPWNEHAYRWGEYDKLYL